MGTSTTFALSVPCSLIFLSSIDCATVQYENIQDAEMWEIIREPRKDVSVDM
jgi:hypothetical protein